MGEVFSQNAGFTHLSAKVWGYIIFHVVTTGLGLVFFDFAVKGRREAETTEA
jgi:hypothetical protein